MVGVSGYHAYLQSKGLPFKSYKARSINKSIFKWMREECDAATLQLGELLGVPEWCKGTSRRNTHTLAIAPTRSNSVIMGSVSAGVEPISSNIYIAKEHKGNFVRSNPFLINLLESKGLNTDEIIDSIIKHNGSVLHLKELTFDEKQVFLTMREIPQLEIIRQQCERQPYIDQAQSINRAYHPDTPIDELNRHIFAAWKNGAKTLYYTKSASSSSLEAVSKTAMIVTKDNCPYCDRAKELLKSNGYTYVEHNSKDIEMFPFKTFPQIWAAGHYIGGAEQFERFVNIQNKGRTSTMAEIDYAECESCSG